MSTFVPLVSLLVVLHATLCLVAPIFATFMIRFGTAGGCNWVSPSPPLSTPIVQTNVESSLLLGKGHSLRPRLPGGVASLAPMHGSRHIVQNIVRGRDPSYFAIFEDIERPRTVPQPLSKSFKSYFVVEPLFFTRIFHDFGKKRGKNRPQNFLEEERKGRIPSQLPFSPFLLVLVWVPFNEELMSYDTATRSASF